MCTTIDPVRVQHVAWSVTLHRRIQESQGVQDSTLAMPDYGPGLATFVCPMFTETS